LTAASGAQVRAGFAHFRYSGVYNVRIPRAQEILGIERTVHTAEHLASAMFFLGAPVRAVPRAMLAADPALAPAIDRPYAVIHPIAAAPEKTWRAEGFMAVASHLDKEHGLEPVFIAGRGEDLSSFAPYRLLPGMPLAQTKALLAGTSLFLGNDSGPAHMAAALGVPVVVLFGASDAAVWSPWQASSGKVLIKTAGIQAIGVDEVVAACEGLRVAQ
jgi:ADP-heptose:LPS heptosyltransferase